MERVYREKGIGSGGYITAIAPLGVVFQFESARQLYNYFTGSTRFGFDTMGLYNVFGGESGCEWYTNARDFVAEYDAKLEAASIASAISNGAATKSKRRGL